jgi:hypothetical protein
MQFACACSYGVVDGVRIDPGEHHDVYGNHLESGVSGGQCAIAVGTRGGEVTGDLQGLVGRPLARAAIAGIVGNLFHGFTQRVNAGYKCGTQRRIGGHRQAVEHQTGTAK